MATGTITKWNERGFGFNRSEEYEHEIFVHAGVLLPGLSELEPGALVEFDVRCR
jgi:cold shock CspA family protein